MRWFVASLLVLASGAQASVLADDAGDESLSFDGEPTPIYTPLGADLTSLEVLDDDSAVTFVVQRTAASADALSPNLEIAFHLGKMTFRIEGEFTAPSGSPTARLVSGSEEDGWRVLELLTAEGTATEWKVAVPRYLLSDAAGVPLPAGAVLEDLRMSLTQLVTGVTNDQGRIESHDVAPDVGNFEHVLQSGPPAHPNVRVTQPRAVFSNGEATTHAFTFLASAPSLETFTFEAPSLPSGWTLSMPTTLDVSDEPTNVTVLLHTAFSHDHGSAQVLPIVVKDSRASSSQVLLTLFYPTFPQLSGHHPKVWVFGGPSEDRVSLETANLMQTSAERPDSLDLQANNVRGYGATIEYAWVMPLTPSLRMPLVFEQDGRGSFSFDMVVEVPAQNLSANVSLIVVQRFGVVRGDVLAVSETQAWTNLQPGTLRLEGDLDVRQMGWTPSLGENVALLVQATVVPYLFSQGTGVEPVLRPGGTATLPLIDPISQVAAGLPNGLAIEDVDVAMHGAQLVLTAKILNDGPRDVKARIEFVTPGVGLASTRVSLAPQEAQRFSLELDASQAAAVGVPIVIAWSDGGGEPTVSVGAWPVGAEEVDGQASSPKQSQRATPPITGAVLVLAVGLAAAFRQKRGL